MNVLRFAFLPSTLLLLVAAPRFSTAQQGQYPLMDKFAQKVVEKYQGSSCEDLKAKKDQPADPKQSAMKQRVMAMLKNDPKMREQFLNKVAGPIANKMFDCGMIP